MESYALLGFQVISPYLALSAALRATAGARLGFGVRRPNPALKVARYALGDDVRRAREPRPRVTQSDPSPGH